MLLFPASTYSCGPYWEEAVFTFADTPDLPLKDFAKGKLGIVLPGFRPAYLVVAYRYLSGTGLSSGEQAAALSVWGGEMRNGNGPDPEAAMKRWLSARKALPDAPAEKEIDVYAPAPGENSYQHFLNCPADAFLSAARTLEQRIGTLGASSSDVRAWVSAQDAVFSNCPGDKPANVPDPLPQASDLARSDRGYQIAAALFYGRKFDQAVAAFDEIAQDRNSPWASIAPYLAARALIRKANLVHPRDLASVPPAPAFDVAAMNAAKLRLQKILADPALAGAQPAARRILGFVLLRTDPGARVAQLEKALLAKDSPDFRQNLFDFTNYFAGADAEGAISDWLRVFGSPEWTPQRTGDSGKYRLAIARWKTLKSLPWLVAALATGSPDDPETPDLISAAAGMGPNSPGYFSVQYYLVRLLNHSGKKAEARQKIDSLLATSGGALGIGAKNLLLTERHELAADFADFLGNAALKPAGYSYGEDVREQDPSAELKSNLYFDRYVAKTFNKRLPLSMIAEAASSTALPSVLRREVVRAAWTRAVLLNDHQTAMRLQDGLQVLDPPLWKEMATYRNAPDMEKKFAALLVVLKNPGLRPYVVAGPLRQATLGKIDDLRENWWCPEMGSDGIGGNYWKGQRGADEDPDTGFPFPEFETEEQKRQAVKERASLAQIGTAPDYLTGQVLDWAKTHAADPNVPAALHFAVRSTRYGCTTKETSRYSKAAFDLLHDRYPKSEWAARTKYHF